MRNLSLCPQATRDRISLFSEEMRSTAELMRAQNYTATYSLTSHAIMKTQSSLIAHAKLG
jgi:hypothetical protein